MKTQDMDRRVKKTRTAIKNSVVMLLSQKNANTVTVKDIVEIADINRKTFYNHYQSIYDVIDEIVLDFAENHIILVEQESNFDYETIFYKFSKILRSNKIFYQNLFNLIDNQEIVNKLYTVLKERIQYNTKKSFPIIEKYNGELLDYILNYMLSGTLKVFQIWLNNDCYIPDKTIAIILSDTTKKIINYWIEKQSFLTE